MRNLPYLRRKEDSRMGFISDNYGIEQTTPIMTDKYHFTTAYAYWREGRADNPAVFYMFGRKEAQGGGYTVAAGLEGVIDIVKRWQEHGLSDDDIKFLRAEKRSDGKPLYSQGFIEYLKAMEFKLKIDAAPEGSAFFPQEPVLRVEGPIAQAKLLESVALGIINGHSACITQAARQIDVITAEMENGSPAGKASVQGLRRGPSLGAAIEASRSLGAGGYMSTSTGTAAKQFGQAFAGTMDHAWIMTHKKELNDVPMADLFKMEDEGRHRDMQDALIGDAFRSYAMAFPDSGIFLVDTYDPELGLEHAITVIKELRALGYGQNYGVRFDSGDIVRYSKIALRRFAEEGFIPGLDTEKVKDMSHDDLLLHAGKCTVFCSAADGIDEYTAQDMREDGAFFKSWGIGTAGSHVPPLGLVYKASSVYMDFLEKGDEALEKDMTPVMKVISNAPAKSSNPGKINSRRFYGEDGKLSYVMIYDEKLGVDPDGHMVNARNFDDKRTDKSHIHADLLVPVFDAEGKYVFPEPEKKESFPGSGKLVTNLAKIAEKVREGLALLPAGARRIARSEERLLKDMWYEDFKKWEAAGGTGMMAFNAEAARKKLPPPVEHVPIYLDQRLYTQRVACETKHLGQVKNKGGAEFKERFG